MQMEEAQEPRDKWKKKGNPSCKHENVEKEYFSGTDTGDKVCAQGGKTF